MKRSRAQTITTAGLAIIVAAFAAPHLYSLWRDSNPAEQAKRASVIIGAEARAETELLKRELHQLDLNAFERKHGFAARLRLEAGEIRQLRASGDAHQCEEEAIKGEAQQGASARFERESKCRMALLEREYEQILKGQVRSR